VILDASIDTRTSATMNTKPLPPPPLCTKDAPLPPPFLLVPLPQETNEILTNLVNLLQEQNRLEHVEKNQVKIPTEVATQIEEAQRRKLHTTPVAVDDATSISANRRKVEKKPRCDSDRGSRSLSPHRSRRGKPSDRHGGKDSPLRQSRRNKEDYSLKRHHKNYLKGPFTRKIVEYLIPRVFAKPPKLETYDGTTDPDEHVEHIDTVLEYHQARGEAKCKLFILTLKGATMTWFKGFEDNSINSWKE